MTNPNAGARVGTAAVGAATGATVGAIQGNNAGTAAASGAAAGAIVGGSQVRRGRRQAAAANKQAEQQLAAKQTAWNNSYVACMSQRGYVAQPAPAK
jgi:outer membrane lipoprotein SlyB